MRTNSPIPAPAIALITDYLSALYGPDPDPSLHLGCCSGRALVLIGPRVERREDVDDASFAAAFATALRVRAGHARSGGRIPPVFELVEAREAHVAEERAAVIARVRETQERREFDAVFVLADDGIVGACVSESDDPDPLLAEARVAAEFAQPPSESGADSCLCGLELSYDRVFGGTLSFIGQYGPNRELAPPVALLAPGAYDMPLRWLPEARFSCAMCGESCRASKWRNAVGDATRQALEAIPWERLLPGRLPETLFMAPDDVELDDWRGDVELAARDDGWCAFFDERAGCLVHGLIGRQPIPSCHQFPFAFTRTPDGVDVWATFHCHAALYGLGIAFADRETDIRTRLWSARTPQRWVGPDVAVTGDRRVTWPVYRAIEAELLAWLDPDSETPLPARLQTAEAFVRLLAEKGGCDAADVSDLAAAAGLAPRLERPAGAPDPLAEGLVAGMFKRYPPLEGERTLELDGLPALLAGLPPPDWEIPRAVMVRYLRHALWHKQFLQTEGVLFTWRLVLLSYATLGRYAWALACLERDGYLRVEPLSPGVRALPIARNPALPYFQKAMQDMDRLVIHAGTTFARFLRGFPAEFDRLTGPVAPASLIWG